MNDYIDNQIHTILNEDEKIPEDVMKKINNSYEMIREKQKASRIKKPTFRKKYSMVAAALMLIIGISSYKPVFAVVKQLLFGTNEAGIQRAVENKYIQNFTNISAESNSVKIEATNIVVDPTKLGLVMKLNFKNKDILKNTDDVWLDMIVKDEKGNIILKDGSGINIIGGISQKPDLSKKDTGEIGDPIILESAEGQIPGIKSLVLEIRNIYLYKNCKSTKKLSGNWTMNIPLESVFENIKTIEYSPVNNNTKLVVINAKSYPTGTLVKFTAKNNNNNESIVGRTKLIDEKGKEYRVSGGATMENVPGNKDLVTMTFDATSFDKLGDLKLKVENLDGKDEFITLKRTK